MASKDQTKAQFLSASQSSAHPRITDPFEPDERWKTRLRTRITESMQGMVDVAGEDKADALTLLSGGDWSGCQRVEDQYQAEMRKIRLMCEEQFQYDLEVERKKRRELGRLTDEEFVRQQEESEQAFGSGSNKPSNATRPPDGTRFTSDPDIPSSRPTTSRNPSSTGINNKINIRSQSSAESFEEEEANELRRKANKVDRDRQTVEELGRNARDLGEDKRRQKVEEDEARRKKEEEDRKREEADRRRLERDTAEAIRKSKYEADKKQKKEEDNRKQKETANTRKQQEEANRAKLQQEEAFRKREEEIKRRIGDLFEGGGAWGATSTSPPNPSSPWSQQQQQRHRPGRGATSDSNASPSLPRSSASSSGSAWSSYTRASSATSQASTTAPTSGSTSFTATPPASTKPPHPPSPSSSPAGGSAGCTEAEWQRRQEKLYEKQQEQFRREQERLESQRQATTSMVLSAVEMAKLYETHERLRAELPGRAVVFWENLPWPMFKRPTNVENITLSAVASYILSLYYPMGAEKDRYREEGRISTTKDRIQEHLRRWHLERFETQVLKRVRANDRERVREGAVAVVSVLNELLTRSSQRSFLFATSGASTKSPPQSSNSVTSGSFEAEWQRPQQEEALWRREDEIKQGRQDSLELGAAAGEAWGANSTSPPSSDGPLFQQQPNYDQARLNVRDSTPLLAESWSSQHHLPAGNGVSSASALALNRSSSTPSSGSSTSKLTVTTRNRYSTPKVTAHKSAHSGLGSSLPHHIPPTDAKSQRRHKDLYDDHLGKRTTETATYESDKFVLNTEIEHLTDEARFRVGGNIETMDCDSDLSNEAQSNLQNHVFDDRSTDSSVSSGSNSTLFSLGEASPGHVLNLEDIGEITRHFSNYVTGLHPCIAQSLQVDEFEFKEDIAPAIAALASYRTRYETAWNHLLDKFREYKLFINVTSVHAAIEEDVRCLVNILHAVLEDPGDFKQYFTSPTSRSQGLLNLIQEILHLGKFREHHGLFAKALLRLSESSGLHPECLSLSSVAVVEGGDAVAGGSFADVWRGKVADQVVAIKKIRMFSDSDKQQLLKLFLREAFIWGQLRHPNVLPFLGLFSLNERLCFVSPWMENNNLIDYLAINPTVDRVILAHDIAHGVAYLHENRIIHGDLKGNNVMITPDRRACITDFGLSSIADSQAHKWTSLASKPHKGGTARWQAPELFRQGTATGNNFATDVYATACTFYEIFAGQLPFYNLRYDPAVIVAVTAGDRPTRPKSNMGLTDLIWDLMVLCWAGDPKSRPTATAILEAFHCPEDRTCLSRPLEGARCDDLERVTRKYPLMPTQDEIWEYLGKNREKTSIL